MLPSARGLNSTVEIARYRGRFGQLEWALHRISGVGVALFLLLHIIDTATVYFAPQAYGFFLALYKNPIFGLAEVALAAALVYHAVNGLRVTIMDFWPRLWERQPVARWFVWAAFLIIFVPIGTIQLINIVRHMIP
jgi:succinate dehydrogenase / fumarate reductase cytochrome b subunit